MCADYLELKSQALFSQVQNGSPLATPYDAAGHPNWDTLVRLAAHRKQLLGPWTPACCPRPIEGLTHREQHRMEQGVYGSGALARAELHGLQAMGQLMGTLSGAACYFKLSQRARRLSALPLLYHPTAPLLGTACLPLVGSMCVGSAVLVLLLPAFATQGNAKYASALRTAGWRTQCIAEPCAFAVTSLGNQFAAACERTGASVAGVVAPRIAAVWRASRLPMLLAAVGARLRSALTQEVLTRELRMMCRVERLNERYDHGLPGAAEYWRHRHH